jgi:hypothetical protein
VKRIGILRRPDRKALWCALCVFTAFTLSTGLHGAESSEPPPPPEAQLPGQAKSSDHKPGNQPARFKGDARTLAQVELLFVKKVCAPTVEQMRAIEAELKACVRDAETGAGPSTCSLLPPRMAERVAKHLSNEQAVRYRAEVKRRMLQECEACVDTAIVLLDQNLDLSESQRNSLAGSLTANWKPAWSQIIELAVQSRQGALPNIPDHLIAPYLQTEQLRVWRRMPKSQAVDDDLPFNVERIGPTGTPVESTKNQ